MPVQSNESPFVVEQLFRANEIHLIFGPLSEDNSALAMYILSRWRLGERIFGHASHPAPFAYVSCERSTAILRDSIVSYDMDPDPQMTPHASMIGERYTDEDGLEGAIRAAEAFSPDMRVLFIDGIYSLCPGRIYDYKDVSRFLRSIQQTCHQRKLTIIACATTTKAKANEGYIIPRDRLHGSGAWASMTATKILIDPLFPSKVTDHSRVVTVMPLNRTAVRFAFRYNDAGEVLRPAPSVVVNVTTLDSWLSEQPEGRAITSQEFLVLATQLDISKATVYRWIGIQIENGSLSQSARGTYVVAPSARAASI